MLLGLHYKMWQWGWKPSGLYSWSKGTAEANLIFTGVGGSKVPELVAFHPASVYVWWWKIGDKKQYPSEPWK